MIRWLHISDLHLGDEDVSSSSMRDDLLTFLSEQDKPFDYIFLTGDIRSAGPRYAGYTPEMADYIKRICDVCHIPVEQLFIVPGNHDIDRDADGRDEAIRRVMFQRNGYYDPYFGIINPEDLECIRDGQKSFRDFLSKIYSDDRLACYSNPQAPHFVVETEDFNILHLDSTISYTKDQEAVDLIVGMEKLCQTLKGLNDRKPTIVLTHYPFTSLLQDERKNLAIRLQKRAYDSGSQGMNTITTCCIISICISCSRASSVTRRTRVHRSLSASMTRIRTGAKSRRTNGIPRAGPNIPLSISTPRTRVYTGFSSSLQTAMPYPR